MTDTETRLRDYLQAKANTVPDDAESPGLVTPRSRSRALTPLLAAAAVIAVLIASVVAVTHLNNPPVNPLQQLPSLPIPYVLSLPDGTRELRDGDQTVRLEKDVGAVLGRVSGGWLIAYTTNSYLLSVLAPDGTRRPVGPATDPGIAHPTLSPDHTQVAVREGTKLHVYDIASGRPVASKIMPSQPELHGWNQAGVWVSKPGNGFVGEVISVWQPKTGTLTSVKPPVTPSFLDVARQATGILTSTYVKPQHCLTYGQLSGGGLTTGPQHCEQGELNPVISPDGKTAALPEGLFDVRSGKLTPLQLGQVQGSVNYLTFEDAEHLLVVNSIREYNLPTSGSTPPPGAEPSPPPAMPGDTVHRCTVDSGACEKVLTAPNNVLIELIEP